MRRARAVATVLGGVLLAGLPSTLAVPAYAEDRVIETELRIDGTPESDGRPVQLDVTIMTTDPETARPAVVLAHGFGGTKDDTGETARTLARDGYTVITFTARGFGSSGGRIHLNDPAYEGADARRIVDLAASRPEVGKVGADPVIGFAGASYGGALVFLAAGLDPRVDAIVSAFTWHRLDQALFPQYQVAGAAVSLADVTPANGGGVFKQGWASRLFTGAGGRGGPPGGDPLCGRFTAELCQGYRRAAETGRATRSLTALLERSGPHPVLADVTAPTLIIAGEEDTLFPLDHADANLRGLPGSTPARMKWVAGGHDGALSVDAVLGDLRVWFGRYLLGDGSPPDTSFSVLVPETSLVGEGGVRDPETRVAAGYPGRGAEQSEQRFDLDGQRQTMLAPPGGTPAALTNLPGSGGALAGPATSVAGYALGVLPGQSATFTTEPVLDPVPVIGSGRVDLEVTSSATSATLFVSLWDLGPEIERSRNGRTTTGPSSAVLPQLAVAPVQLSGLTPGRPERVTVALPPVSHQVPVDHRLQVVVSTTDQAYALPDHAAVYQVALTEDGTLVLPQVALEVLGGNALDVPLPLIVGVALMALAALLAMFWLWRQQRDTHPEPSLAQVPLLVTDVAKTYRYGIRAVDGVSFRAETGQVVGLLGPNGAGKTTLIRMLVGLIRPDSGEIYVHGEPVHAGADMLASVGSFIEGPGFLPHLTGRENLRAYWHATGRPFEEAHLEEAIEIAGLGAALERRVRGYSHGMRQRLGIAQAMLGLPSLLILDEPTNGLDPPQIKTMRQVLADYAAAGRTVVISSHLLGEVEQTCSHVVVMDKGKIVLTGAVSALTASDTVTMIGLADGQDLSGAERHLDAKGISAERAGTMLRIIGQVPRADIVRELVNQGYRIESVDGHRQLEEVFLSLVGGPSEVERDGHG